ncbi:MAG: molybdopterin-guanine dinucleotide biosynthesis protein B [Lutisporaceae bacterium]
MKVFSVTGFTQSGKTTTIERIIAELRSRGYSVGSVKEIHFEDFKMDKEGTNTYRHKQAGSQLVTALGYHETDILFQEKLQIEKVLEFYNYDYVVLEGVYNGNYPMILTAHNEQELDERWNPYVFCVSGRISKDMREFRGVQAIDAMTDITSLVDLIELKVYDKLPAFPPECCSACGFSCTEMGTRILTGISHRSECKISNGNIKLYIDEKEISMVPFVQALLRNAVLGVVKELDGYRDNASIKVTLGDKNDA